MNKTGHYIGLGGGLTDLFSNSASSHTTKNAGFTWDKRTGSVPTQPSTVNEITRPTSKLLMKFDASNHYTFAFKMDNDGVQVAQTLLDGYVITGIVGNHDILGIVVKGQYPLPVKTFSNILTTGNSTIWVDFDGAVSKRFFDHSHVLHNLKIPVNFNNTEVSLINEDGDNVQFDSIYLFVTMVQNVFR